MKLIKILRENKAAYLGLLPLLLFFVFLMWYPFLQMVLMSFRKWLFLAPIKPWVGLKHYVDFIGSEVFWFTLYATLFYFIATFVQMGLGIVAAFALDQGFIKFAGFFFILFIAPVSIPPIVSGAMWRYILDPTFGIGMYLLKQVGIIKEPIYWTFNAWPGMVVITSIISWTRWPLFFLMIYARLKSIPKSQVEASLILGASWMSTLRKVLLPQVKTTLIIVFLIRVAQNYLKVSPILALTRGGPSYRTSIWPVLLYKYGFEQHELGKASMVGVLLFLLMILLMYPGIRLFNKRFGKEVT